MSLILISHIILALSSVALSTLLMFRPSKNKLNGTYVLFGGALATGTYLIFTSPAHILQTCVLGIAYTAFVVGGIAVARKKLGKVNIHS